MKRRSDALLTSTVITVTVSTRKSLYRLADNVCRTLSAVSDKITFVQHVLAATTMSQINK